MRSASAEDSPAIFSWSSRIGGCAESMRNAHCPSVFGERTRVYTENDHAVRGDLRSSRACTSQRASQPASRLACTLHFRIPSRGYARKMMTTTMRRPGMSGSPAELSTAIRVICEKHYRNLCRGRVSEVDSLDC